MGYYYLALSWYHKGNFSESLKNHKKSLDLSREPGDKYRTGKSHYAIGQVLRRQGLYPEALRNFLEAVEIQRELGSREDLAQAYLGIAGLYGSYDEHAKGLKYYGTAKEIMVEIGNYRSMADCLVCMGRSLDAMGEFDDDQDRIHPQRNGRGDVVRVTWNRVRKSLGGRMDDKPLDLLNRLEQREAELTLKQA